MTWLLRTIALSLWYDVDLRRRNLVVVLFKSLYQACAQVIAQYVPVCTFSVEYSKRTAVHRKSYKSESTSTIGRWIKAILEQSGVDTEQLKPTVLEVPPHRRLSLAVYLFLKYVASLTGQMSRPFRNSIEKT